MMATVQEDISIKSLLRVISKNIDLSNSHIQALIGTERELEFTSNLLEIKDLGNLNNHLRMLTKREVTPNDRIPDKTIGYIVTYECYPGHMSTAYVLRDKVYTQPSVYERLMNPQEGDALWN